MFVAKEPRLQHILGGAEDVQLNGRAMVTLSTLEDVKPESIEYFHSKFTVVLSIVSQINGRLELKSIFDLRKLNYFELLLMCIEIYYDRNGFILCVLSLWIS